MVVYVYFCYPLCVFVLSKLRPFKVAKRPITPTVSIIIAAYNEEKAIAEKIENTLSLDYARDNLEIIVVSDGSTDRTEEIALGYESAGVKIIALPENMGKSEAQNAGMAQASSEIIVFSDADTLLRRDAIRNMTAYFGDLEVGCVIGRHIFEDRDAPGVAAGEGVYWRYESWLREQESRAGNLAVGSGILGIRTDLATTLDRNVGEDMVLPLGAAIAGKKVVYARDVISYHVVLPRRSADLFHVKARIVSKDLRGLWLNRGILNPFRYPLYSWGLISHKLLRWLVPFFLLGILLTDCYLIGHGFYKIVFGTQVALYVLAIAGLVLERLGVKIWISEIPLSFCVVNAAAFFGVLRFVSGKKHGRWKPVRATE